VIRGNSVDSSTDGDFEPSFSRLPMEGNSMICRRDLRRLLFFLALCVLDAIFAIDRSFERIGNMTTSRSGHAATLLRDGRVLLTGGFVREAVRIDGNFYGSASSAPSYTTLLMERSTRRVSMHIPRWMGTSTLLDDGRVLIAGGCYCPEAEIYDPSSGTFTRTGRWSRTQSFCRALRCSGTEGS
jgi:hypothetical protein